MTPQEAFWNSWFGISLLGMTVATLLLTGSLVCLYVRRRAALGHLASKAEAAD